MAQAESDETCPIPAVFSLASYTNGRTLAQWLVEQLAIRHHLLPHGLAPDAEARNVQPLPDAAGFTFELGAAQYRYTRLGLEVVPT